MTQFVYEFLYRGRAPGDKEPAAWQVELRDTDDPSRQGPVLNMTLAIQQGWDKTAILSAINARAVSDRVIADNNQHDILDQLQAAVVAKSVAEDRAAKVEAVIAAANSRAEEANNRAIELGNTIDYLNNQLQALQAPAPVSEPERSTLSRLSFGLLR